MAFNWNDGDKDPDKDPKEKESVEAEVKKSKKSKVVNELVKKKDTEVPLMPISANELPIIPKFIHVQNSYAVNEETYNELIELIRNKRSRNVAIFQKVQTAEELQTEAEAVAEQRTNESPSLKETKDKQKEKESKEKKDQKFNFVNVDKFSASELEQLKFNPELVKDVTEHFLQEFLPIGTYGVLSALQNVEKHEGLISVNFYGLNRCKLKSVLEVNSKFHLIEIEHLEEDEVMTEDYKSRSKEILNLIQTIYTNADQPTRYAVDLLKANYDLTKPTDLFLYSLVVLTLSQFSNSQSTNYRLKLSQAYQLTDQGKQLDAVSELLNMMIEEIKIKQDVNLNIEEIIRKQQKEEALRMTKKYVEEQLNQGKGGLKKRKLEKLNQNFKELDPPKLVAEIFTEEMERIEGLDSNSVDYSLAINYLEILTTVPWGKFSKEQYDIKKARGILDRDHYGMQDVKDRILEFIAVGILRGDVYGKILCLHGPPGVGKTSIAKGIAEALDREFFRISLGGAYDVSELKGHRRTYVGSQPGKIIQALRRSKTQNPLILLDEIDKVGSRGGQNDLSATLLEVLDFSQNDSFVDNYMDIPIDLSKVLFITTANDLSPITAPLLDRLELISVSGYSEEEKTFILNKYLLPQAYKKSGLDSRTGQFTINDSAKTNLIKYYARESGVRSLEKFTNRIAEKIAFKIVSEDQEFKKSENSDNTNEEHKEVEDKEGKEKREDNKSTKSNKNDDIKMTQSFDEEGNAGIQYPHFEVNESNLKDYAGNPRFMRERMYKQTPVGVSTGLAYTSMGGSVLFIETLVEPELINFTSSPMSSSSGKDENSSESNDGDKKEQKDNKPSVSGIKVTGNLGKTMTESIDIAYSYSKHYLNKLYKQNPEWFQTNNVDPNFLTKHKIHLHVPEGATPKDGPSAGITITCAILSLVLDRPLVDDIGMTGEISLMGHVLPIGGLKEKLIASRRENLKTIVVPANNQNDYEELPDDLKKELSVHFVKTYDEVFAHAFANIFNKEDKQESK